MPIYTSKSNNVSTVLRHYPIMQNRNIAFFCFFHSQPALVGCGPPPSPPSHPPPLPSFEAFIEYSSGMDGQSSATSGSWLNYRLTTKPCSSVNPPTTCPVTARLLELYQECVENGVWASVLYEGVMGLKTHLSLQNNASFITPAWTRTSQREETCARQEAQGGLGREEAYPLSGLPPPSL
jgi:hypothetical protein